MKSFLTTLFSLMLWVSTTLSISAQCTFDDFGQWPGATFTPACSGSAEVISTLCFAGEYSVVNVTNGTMYTFSSSIATDYLTITNAAASTNYAWGVSPITWTATFTGTIRFWTHTSSACGSDDVDFRDRRVQCGTPPPPGQCLNSTSFGSAAVGTGAVVTITTCQFAGEYATISGVTNGMTLRFTSSVATDYLTVRSGTPGGPVVGAGLTPLTVTATSTGTYYLHTNTSSACGAQSSCRTTTVQCTSCTAPPPPANDLCANAVTITCGQSLAGTTVSATADNAGTCTTTNTQPGVWYRFVGTGLLTSASTCTGTTLDTKISVYTGSCGTFTCVAGNDDACGLQSTVNFNSTNGTVYYILVHQFSATGGTFNLAITCTEPVANDVCANAIEIPCGGSAMGTTIGASADNAGTCGTTNTQPGVWYKFVGTGNPTRVSTCGGATWDTKISVFSGTCGSLVCVAGNDDACALQSAVDFTSTAGTTYYFLVHQFGATGGTFTLSVTTECVACRGTNPPTVTNLTGTAATINWNAVTGTTGYSYTVGAGLLLCPSSSTVVNTTSTSANLTGLLPGTDYTVCVRVNTCTGGNAPSAWSSVRFTTPGSCETPSQPFVSGLTTTSATLTWPAVPGVTSYKYSRGSSSTCANGTLTTTGSNTVTLTGLTPGTTYYFCVQSDCGSSVSGFVSARFTTLAAPGSRPAGTNEGDLMEYSVYPNPANEDINLALNNFPAGKSVNVQIINQLGQTMVTHRFTNENNHVETIKVDQLPDGIYIMSVQAAGTEQKFKKFVKGALRP